MKIIVAIPPALPKISPIDVADVEHEPYIIELAAAPGLLEPWRSGVVRRRRVLLDCGVLRKAAGGGVDRGVVPGGAELRGLDSGRTAVSWCPMTSRRCRVYRYSKYPTTITSIMEVY